MQRILNNLTAVLAIGLMSLSGSLAFAHGGGGGHSGGGHSSGRSSGHASQSHASHHNVSQTQKNNTGRQKATSKSVSNKRVHPPRNPRNRHPRPRYHMHYPVGFWFDGDIDDGDADADAVEGGVDVEFTSIRQIDAGDAAKNLAPAYRVWFHNNSTVDIDQPFDVAILASTDQKLAKNLPFASVRVQGMAADETSSVDIRLPISAMSMGSDDDTVEYSYLHTIVDSQRELTEANKANNLSVYASDDIPDLDE